MPIQVKRYEGADQALWDAFVDASKNGTFLFRRDYMDYHADRFDDCSLLFFNNEKLQAILPANRSGDDVHSHQGLTYGGFVTSYSMTVPGMVAIAEAACASLRSSGARRLMYKTIPAIYHRIPAEEDLHALFQAGAALYRRDVLSVVHPSRLAPVQSRRRRGAQKAQKTGVVISRSTDWPGFWALLSGHLSERFGSTPVHSLNEIERLSTRFQDNITLYVAELSGELLAGIVLYETSTVARTQYIASSDTGRQIGALDLLIFTLLDNICPTKLFVDLGSSNGALQGTLNTGLIEQKEGFGARTVVHDFYQLDL